jgi:excinuclease UvrABC nuclease subunit
MKELEAEMNVAAEEMQFERAAALRDKLQPLLWLHQRLNGLTRARDQLSFIYPVQAAGVEVWYFIRRGRVLAAIHAPQTDCQRASAAQLIEQTYFSKETIAKSSASFHIDHVLLVSSWFRKYEAERQRTIAPTDALAALAGKIPLAC